MLETIRALARERLWRLELHVGQVPSLVEASITPRTWWTLHFRLDAEAEKKLQRLGIDPHHQRILAKTLVEHETGHWEICPFDQEGIYLILEGVVQALRESAEDHGVENTPETTRFLCNLVADSIVDVVRTWQDPSGTYADGLALHILKTLRALVPHRFWQAYTYLEMLLWGERTALASEVLSCLWLDHEAESVAEEAAEHWATWITPQQLCNALPQKAHWKTLAEKLCRSFLPLLPPADQCIWWLPDATGSCHLQGLLYEGRSGLVRIETEHSPAQTNTGLPLTPLLHRPVDFSAPPPPDRILWQNSLVLPRYGRRPHLMLSEVSEPLCLPASGPHKHPIIPDIAFLLDSSGSMDYDPDAGQGEYDTLLRAVFGVFRWLKTVNLLALLNFAVLNFSSETYYSGWCSWRRKEKLYDVLFRYQGELTLLDMSLVRLLCEEAPRPFVPVMISDGDVMHWEHLLQFVKDRFRPPDGFFLLQIGQSSDLATGLQKAGFSVTFVDHPSQLRHCVLGAVQQRFRF
uniref:VWA domain-containing protein n=1 Tax=Desulfacinum infernum TaxID=35837 RepID=A0A832EDS2_9BACT